MKRFVVREIKYNKKGRRVGGYKEVFASSEMEAAQKGFGGFNEIEPLPFGAARQAWKRRHR